MEIKLYPLEKKHLKWLLEIRNHESTRSQLGNDSIFTLKECEKWFETLESPWYVVVNENLQWVGYVRTDKDTVGCDIHPDHRRKGYAKKTYQKYLKDKEYAELWVFEDNYAKKLYEKLGFKETNKVELIRGRNYLKMIYENRN